MLTFHGHAGRTRPGPSPGRWSSPCHGHHRAFTVRGHSVRSWVEVCSRASGGTVASRRQVAAVSGSEAIACSGWLRQGRSL